MATAVDANTLSMTMKMNIVLTVPYSASNIIIEGLYCIPFTSNTDYYCFFTKDGLRTSYTRLVNLVYRCPMKPEISYFIPDDSLQDTMNHQFNCVHAGLTRTVMHPCDGTTFTWTTT